MAIAKEKYFKFLNRDPSLEDSADFQYIQHDELIKEALLREIINELKIPANDKIDYLTVLADQIDLLGGILTKGGTG